jgi:putative colanic acid biosysnthesis UDP-glucose lipid carrier transferase
MSPRKRQRRRTIGGLQKHAHIIWMLQRVVDAAIAVVLLWGLGLVYHVHFSAPYIFLAALTILAMWPTFKTMGLYYSYRSEHPAATYPRIWGSWAIVLMLLLLIGYITQTSESFNYPLLCSWFALTPFALCLHHLGLRILLRQLRATGLNSRKAVIAGTGEHSQMLARQLQESPHLGLQFHGFFTDQPLEPMAQISIRPLIGTLAELPDYVRRHQVDVVYIALALQSDVQVSDLINALQDTTVCVYFVPNITAFSLMQARVHNVAGIPLISVWETPLTNVQIVAKRITDICVAATILVLTSPLVLGIAIALKLTSSGSVIVNQLRYGFNGQAVSIYKFQTAPLNSGSEETPKLTYVGAFLRKTGLESLPQLINVLKGDMSIVGPRPQLVAHAEIYRKHLRSYCLGDGAIKPGLTGWAQIHGLCGESETQETLQQRIAYDLDYLKNWSFWLDLKIMSRTTLEVLKRQNAY